MKSAREIKIHSFHRLVPNWCCLLYSTNRASKSNNHSHTITICPDHYLTQTGTPQGKNRKPHTLSCNVGPKPNIPPKMVASFNVLTEVAHSRKAIQTDHRIRRSHFSQTQERANVHLKGLASSPPKRESARHLTSAISLLDYTKKERQV